MSAGHGKDEQTFALCQVLPHWPRLTAEVNALGVTGVCFVPPGSYPGGMTVMHDKATALQQEEVKLAVVTHAGMSAAEVAEEKRERRHASVTHRELLDAVLHPEKADALRARLA